MLDNVLLKKHLLPISVWCLVSLSSPAFASVTGANPSLANADNAHSMFNLPPLSQADYQWIGAKIYQNECNSQSKNLTFWGEGEAFPSFGIGHFIWFPEGVNPPFNEIFPAMFEFVSKTVKPPAWLLKLDALDAPWQTKKQFEQAWSGSELTQLRTWLEKTQAQQAQFIVAQFRARLESVLKTLPTSEQVFYKTRLAKLVGFKQGRFALIDYVNFKGVGGNPKEQYQGQEWGLLSVLQAMDLTLEVGQKIGETDYLNAFINSAKGRLLLRTQLAPVERHEQRWLKGWYKRLEDYQAPAFKRQD